MRHEIEKWLLDLGFEVPNLDFNGKFLRFGENKNSWFIGHEFSNMCIATVGDWRTGTEHTWRPNKTLTKNEKRMLDEQIKVQRQRIEHESQESYRKAAIEVEKVFANYSATIPETEYTKKKKIAVHKDARVGHDDNSEFLVIPLRDIDGRLWTVQRIYGDGSKRFFSGGRKKGNFFAFGPLIGDIHICEGYATGYSLSQSGRTVVAAMDAGNLEPVAIAIRERYPKAQIIFAADRDTHGVGEQKAIAAAEKVGGRVILPREPYKDFNDEACAESGIQVIEAADVAGPMPDVSKQGKPLGTIENLEHLLKQIGAVVRYNVISKDVEILVPGQNFLQDNKANVALAWLRSWASRVRMPTDSVKEYVAYIADQNLYNPVATWIHSRPWDGKDRLNDLYATIKCRDEEAQGLLKEVLIKRWLISAVAAAFEPNGVSAHGVLSLQGDQGLGKTFWFKRLVPQELRLTKDGVLLIPSNKDSVKQTVSNWLVELGEVDSTFRKSDIAQLKAFLTSDKDVLRRPFAHNESEYPRRTVFFASVNLEQFLNDSTGNRRFWTIACESIDNTREIDMQQVWAQVYDLYDSGEPWVLERDELALLNEHNESFESVDPVDELISTKLDWNAPPSSWVRKTATDLLIMLGLKAEPREQKRAAANLKKRGMEWKKSNGSKLFTVPPLVR